MPSSSVAHVALVRDGHADLADLAARELVVGVVAGLGRQVERDRQARLALGQVRAVQLVRGLGRSSGPSRCASSTAGRARGGGATASLRRDCKVRPVAGPSARRARTSLRLRALDARDRLSGRAGPLVPPRRLQFVGEGDFVGDRRRVPLALRRAVRPAARGPRARRRLRDRPAGAPARGLPEHRRAPTPASTSTPPASRWCTERYGHFPQFAFAHADVRNARYNPGGHGEPATYRFPYDDGAFDVAVADLRPHPPDRRRGDCTTWPDARVLAPAGACSPPRSSSTRSTRPTAAARLRPGPRDGMAVVDEALPEEAVAYERDWLLEALRAAGLDLVAIHPGTWTRARGRPELPGRGGRRVRDIDVPHLGVPRVICCHVIDDVIVDPGPESTMDTLLAELGRLGAGEDPADAHPPRPRRRGRARSRSAGPTPRCGCTSAARATCSTRRGSSPPRGADLRRRHGPPLGRDAARCPRSGCGCSSGGEVDRPAGAWRTRPGTPRTTSRYLHEPTGTAMVGDVAGCRIADGPILPPTPPPDVDLEAWHASLRAVAGVGARAHRDHPLRHVGGRRRAPRGDARGPRPLGRGVAADRRRRLRRRDRGGDAEQDVRPGRSPRRSPDAMPPKMLWAGWARYWAEREKAAAAD